MKKHKSDYFARLARLKETGVLAELPEVGMNDLDRLGETLAQIGKTLNRIVYLVLLTMTMTLISTLGMFFAVYVLLLHFGVL